ncbi:hypothetical protein O181_113719 [Austropuccinia psidii MF-1]|uniref:Tf2-1-like SH3-like domain-containing protein n=1 Tax=Austropuccinia psidii MF-1 TaxID=1389203 RepID=A0A9Q3K423_9BASI|nr:hypothetical protein [Austropuccinia psidii MF-1]
MVWLSSKSIKSTRTAKKLSERWSGPFPILKKVSTHAYHLKLLSQWKSIHPVFHISLSEPVKTSKIPNRHKSLLLQSSLKKKRNGKSLKYWTQSLREANSGIWCNGKVSVKTWKDTVGNQPKTSRIALKLSRTLILYILTSQDPIHKEIYHLGCLVGRGITKDKSHSWYAT